MSNEPPNPIEQEPSNSEASPPESGEPSVPNAIPEETNLPAETDMGLDADLDVTIEEEADFDDAEELDVVVVAVEPEAPEPATSSSPPPPPPAATVPASAPASPTATATASSPTSASKSQTFLRFLGQLWDIVLAVLPVIVTLGRQLGRLLLRFFNWIRETWAVLLPKLRPLLPEPFKTKLPNPVVTATALGLLALLLWLTSTLSSGRPAPAAEVSDRPTAPEIQPAPQPAPKQVALAPDKVADLQAQLTTISDRYIPGLIESIQPNLSHSRLTIHVTPAWYRLEPTTQDQVSNEWLKRVHKLKFDRLDLTDSLGTLVARNPVVGPAMLILQREAPPELQSVIQADIQAEAEGAPSTQDSNESSESLEGSEVLAE